MFQRSIQAFLHAWQQQAKRKPLVLRGARQVGKTTAVKQFGKSFDHFIYLNLDSFKDRELFEKNLSVSILLESILFHKNISRHKDQSLLIFIDEIQSSPAAIAMLRYFYEEHPDIHVIAAGSLLESLIDTHISFPVGRVEYIYLYPLTFEEFLLALDETKAWDALQEKTPPVYAHDKLFELFHLYTMLGGMPEVIASFIQDKDWIKLSRIYESLLLGYQNDVEKYAANDQQARIIRYVIARASFHAGTRITFQHFAQSNYSSREIGDAMRILEKALLLKLTYPTTALQLPFEPDFKKSPRLQFLDTGIVNYVLGLQKELFHLKDLSTLYQGRIVEHIVGQQMLGNKIVSRDQLLFWVREKAQSTAEIDYVIAQGARLIPIEIKSGKTGTLRSLHSFIDHAEDHTFAIRLYHGPFSRESITSLGGKKFELLNLPYYLCGQLERYLE